MLIQKMRPRRRNTHVNMSAMGKVDETELVKRSQLVAEQPSGWCKSKISHIKDDQSSQCMRTVVINYCKKQIITYRQFLLSL